jgi:hypothetical protein
MNEKPLIISRPGIRLFGIHRTSSANKRLVILIPALYGTRIGPQRLYVELARHLLLDGISSFAVDLPPNGDSVDECVNSYVSLSDEEDVDPYYRRYLDMITSFFENEHPYEEYILCSISRGCIPMLDYAADKKYERVIDLSPTLTVEAPLEYPLHILNIFGEREKFLSNAKEYWSRCHFASYTEKTIKDADHSFFGWGLKKNVCTSVSAWLNSTST